MNKLECNRRNMERFRDCINTNDKALAEELIDPKAEFARLISRLWAWRTRPSRIDRGRET